VSGPKIRLSHLSFRYGGTDAPPVIADFSLDVRGGEFVSIVGPSGCGKTTLLNIVAHLVPPSSGQVLVDGATPRGPGPDRSMVFQDDAVFPWRTVEGNVAYGLESLGHAKAEVTARVNRYVELVGLASSRGRFPRELSGGMRKRVDLARAMAPEPAVLLMDEPFASLDVMTKEQLQAEFMGIWQLNPVTVLFVTHDLEEAIFLSDRVVAMSPPDGRITRVLHVDLPRPRHPEVKTEPEFQSMRRELASVFHLMGGRA